MNSRFIKHNKGLVGILAITLVVVITLAVLLVIEYIKMADANNKVTEMGNAVNKLQDKRFNKVIALTSNLGKLEEDAVFYKAKNDDIKKYFGRPYAKALDAMAKEMEKEIFVTDAEGKKTKKLVPYKDGDDLANNFVTFLFAQNEDASIRFDRFRKKNEAKWNAGIAAFATEAKKVAFENITPANATEYFFLAVGLSRDIVGGNSNYTTETLTEIEKNLFNYVVRQNINGENIVGFDLFSKATVTEDYNDNSVATMNAEITSDLIKRLCTSSPKINSLESVKFSKYGDWKDVDNGKINSYKVVFTGTVDSIRAVLKSLNDAVGDNRVYVLKNAKISIDPESDEAAKILKINAPPRPRAGNNRNNNNRDNNRDGSTKSAEEIEMEIQLAENDAKRPYNERRAYGKSVIGATKLFVAEFDIDYYYFKKNVNANRRND